MNANEIRARLAIAGLLVALVALAAFQPFRGAAGAQPAATPAAGYSCQGMMPGGTPGMGSGMGMHGGTPMAGMGAGMMMMEFDQGYIDMMIPHHASIIALAEAALPELTDPRLIAMAQAIIEAQTAEIDELRGYREQWYGSATEMPMESGAMMQMMPGMMMSPDEMAAQMNPHMQVATFCAAADPNLAFIDLVIPHHQSAIDVSRTALEQATHDEIKAFAQRVIDHQQREIDELTTIRAELSGAATPTA